MDKKTYRFIKIPILMAILCGIIIVLGICVIEQTILKVVVYVIAAGMTYVGFSVYKDCISFNKDHIYIRATLFNTDSSPQGSRPQGIGFNKDEITKVTFSDNKNSFTKMKLINFVIKGNRKFSLPVAGFTKSQFKEICQRLNIKV